LTELAVAGGGQASLLAQPGTVAFLVVFGMAVMCYFVFKSMSRHLRKVNQAARDEAEAAVMAQQGPGGGASADVG
jgi:hypothetical protein